MTQWLKFVNQGGIPAIQSVAINTTGTVTTFSFNNHPYRQTNRFYGFFAVKIAQDTSAITSTNTVQFDTQGGGGSTVDVYQPNGQIANVNELTSLGQSVYLCFYDKDNNRVQIID